MKRPDEARIRDFQLPDVVPVQRLIYQTIDACYSGVYPPRAVQFFKEFHSEEKIIERSQKGQIVVLEQGGKVIGTGTIVGSEIFGVFVAPEFQHRGHGATLLRELETKARTNGCKEAELSVSLPSRDFYESLGYDILEEASIEVGAGERVDFWKASKRL